MPWVPSSTTSTSTSTPCTHHRGGLLVWPTCKKSIWCLSDINCPCSALVNSCVKIKWLRRNTVFLDVLCISHLCRVQNRLVQITLVFNYRDLLWRLGSFLEHKAKTCVLTIVSLTFMLSINRAKDILCMNSYILVCYQIYQIYHAHLKWDKFPAVLQ